MAKKGALETWADRALDTGLGSLWSRFGPLSTGAVAGSALIVGGAAIVRRAARSSHRARWLGAAALVPLGLWVLRRGLSGRDDGGGDGGHESAAGTEATIDGNGDATDEDDDR